MIQMNKKFKFGFTMAEAILVMTILGIIATIMITTLKPAQFKEQALKILAKKVMGEIDNAVTQVMINDTKNGTLDEIIYPDGTVGGYTNIVGYSLAGMLKKYLVTIRTNVGVDSFCYNGYGTDSYGTVTCAYHEQFYLKDGACVGYGVCNVPKTIFPGEDTPTATTTGFALLFDTNGLDEPNTLGKDQFILPVDKNGIMY